MAIRLYRAYSPGTRFRSTLDFSDLTKTKPERRLTVGKKYFAGRNNRGLITLRGRGGGHKKKYRIIDFQRKLTTVKSKVASIEYDPTVMLESLFYIMKMVLKSIFCAHDH